MRKTETSDTTKCGVAKPENIPFASALSDAMANGNLKASEVARRIWGTTKDKRGYDVARNRDRIGHYMKGTSYPEPDTLIKLAEAVGVPVARLAIDRPVSVAARVRQAVDIHLTVLADQPSKARLQFDRILDFDTAVRIMQELSPGAR